MERSIQHDGGLWQPCAAEVQRVRNARLSTVRWAAVARPRLLQVLLHPGCVRRYLLRQLSGQRLRPFPNDPRNPTGSPLDGYRNPPCAPPASFTVATNPAPWSCRFDPAYFINNIAPSERFAATGDLTWQVTPDEQFFVNGLYARNTFTLLGSPTQISRPFLQPSSPFYPHEFAAFFGIDGRPLEHRVAIARARPADQRIGHRSRKRRRRYARQRAAAGVTTVPSATARTTSTIASRAATCSAQ